jgi:hypothetical protein
VTEQYDLYRGTPPHVATATSLDAAVKIKKSVRTLQSMVLAAIRACGEHGATDFELEQGLEMIHQTLSARRRELVLKDLIRDSGVRRLTRGGRTAIVWVAQS